MRGPRHLEPLRSCQNVLSSIGINQVTRLGNASSSLLKNPEI
jgi:hypothetical protein